MNTRRDLLKAAALTSGAAAFTGCTEQMTSGLNRLLGEGVPASLDPPQAVEIDPDFHLLSRAAFGPWPGDLERLKEMGRDEWIEEQLRPERIDDTLCDFRAQRFESLFFSAGDAYEFRRPVLREELTRHSLIRAVYSRRQLFEVMAEFWTDHLNIDLEKGDCIYLKPADDRDVIRKHALGNFHDLIRASATSPAMLVYLDGRTNKVEKNRKGEIKPGSKPNENYARELLELHTLGVDGGYSQQDVFEAARCLSGWTVDLMRGMAADMFNVFAHPRGTPWFRGDWHDDGEKRVLGQVIPAGGGERDLGLLVDIVCSHPGTARHIAKKLCRRFVSIQPPQALVDRVAAEFSNTGGDIKSLLRVIFKSDEFLASRGQLLKRPFKFIVSSLRALAADTHANRPLVEALNRMGHGLFQYPTPDGYPDEETPWMGTLMWRWNFALALANADVPTVKVDIRGLHRALGNEGKAEAEAGKKWFAHLAGRQPAEKEWQALQTLAAAERAKGGEKNSEQKQKAELLGVMLASPAFQRC